SHERSLPLFFLLSVALRSAISPLSLHDALPILWASGRALTSEAAVALALDEPVKPVPSAAPPSGKGAPGENPAPAIVRRYRVAAAPPSSLTLREYEIAELVVGGLSNKAIAAELSISHTTAARH